MCGGPYHAVTVNGVYWPTHEVYAGYMYRRGPRMHHALAPR